MGVREASAGKHRNEFTKKKITARERYDRAISNALGKLCIEWGFCGDHRHAPFDQKRDAWTADEFAFEILRAEGMNPLEIEGIGPSQSDWFRRIRARFVAEFGDSVSVHDFESE